MVASFDTGNFLVTLEDGVYTANRQNGVHTHDDGNTTHKFLAPYPNKGVPGQFYARSEVAGLCAVGTETVVLEMTDGNVFLLQFSELGGYSYTPFQPSDWGDGGNSRA